MKQKFVIIAFISVLVLIGFMQIYYVYYHTKGINNNGGGVAVTDTTMVDIGKTVEEKDISNQKRNNVNHVDGTIFVSMAAYRDELCSDTLSYLFENAQHPQNVYIGLVDQGTELLDHKENAEHPDWPTNSYCFRGLRATDEWVKNNIRYMTLPIEQSKGPTYARYLASKLFQNETYYMQIDSHLRFVESWDTFIISNHWALKNIAPRGRNGVPRAILTHYPLPFEKGDVGLPADDQTQVPKLCKGIFNSRGLMTFNSYILRATRVPQECPFVAAGFFFGTSEMMETVPYDPYLPNMFEGEEILHTIRMWVHGYRFYAPTMNICYHYYTRKDSPKFWEDNREYYKSMGESVDRARYILGFDHLTEEELKQPKYQDLEPYDIKNKSLILDYWKTFDINVQDQTHDYDKWCK